MRLTVPEQAAPRAGMRSIAAAIAFAFALPLAGAADGRPGVDAYFDAMAIAVKPGEQRQFVVGDNLAGYFEGYTQSGTRGQGYQMKQATVLRNYASFVDGRLNERGDSQEQVLPYGHRVRYASGATEEMALLSKQYALAMRVTAPSAAELAIAPLLAVSADGYRIERVGDVVIFTPRAPVAGAGYPQFLALAADRDFVFDAAQLKLKSAAATSLTVVAAFGNSAEEAAAHARALAHGRPIEAEKRKLYAELTKSYLATDNADYNKALNWAKAASRMFVVEEFGTGIWAGLPWFRDNWGRDSFIALPGTLLVSGQFDQAKAVLANFARYQNLREPRDKQYGRIPNRVSSGDIIYNTVDGTPWMLREALEYIRYTGDKAFAAQIYKLALPYFEGAIANFADADGLLTHDDADTWMDARIEGKQPWSARGPRAVEIQALWYTALETGAYLAAQAGDEAKAREWTARARRAQQSFLRLFWDGRLMADRLRADASRDTKIRPNQLMLVSIPGDDFVPLDVQAKVTRNAVSELLYPYGIASLSQNDPYFHPRHENPGLYHKDAAYHQGTVWGWNAGFTVTALDKFGYQDLAWSLSKNLGAQILHLGTLGNMSELLDALPQADGTLKPSGTFAQSWSVAEYARNAYQDYVGFKPNLLEDALAFSPAIPDEWKTFYAALPFGAGEELEVDFRRLPNPGGAAASTGTQEWTLRLHDGAAARHVSFNYLNADKSRALIRFDLRPGATAVLHIGPTGANLDGQPLASTPAQPSFAATIGPLHFQTPAVRDFDMLRHPNALHDLILRGDYR